MSRTAGGGGANMTRASRQAHDNRDSRDNDTESEKSILGDTKRGQLRMEGGQARIDFA